MFQISRCGGVERFRKGERERVNPIWCYKPWRNTLGEQIVEAKFILTTISDPVHAMVSRGEKEERGFLDVESHLNVGRIRPKLNWD